MNKPFYKLFSREIRITSLLKEAFAPSKLEIINDSSSHSRGGNETHYRVLISSSAFENLTSINKQRKVYEILKPEFALGMHSLALQAYSESEYMNQELQKKSACISQII